MLLTLIAHISCILHFLTVTWSDTLVLPLGVGRCGLGEDGHALVLAGLAHVGLLGNNFGSSMHNWRAESLLARCEHILTAIMVSLMTTVLLLHL